MVDTQEVAIFKATIQDETAKFWNQMERRLKEIESLGRKAFNRLEDKIDEVGQAAGEAANSRNKGMQAMILRGNLLSSGITKGLDLLITSFTRLASAGVRALGQILEKGNEINAALEVSEKTFGAVFGDAQLGKETIKFLDEISARLGINRAQATEFARAILPRTESTEQFAQILELTEAQARATGSSLEDLAFSMREALAGDPQLLRDRFDLDRGQIAKIKEMTTEIGAAQAILDVLGPALRKRGIANLEDFADTGVAVRQSLGAVFDDLQATFAKPIFDAQTESLVRLRDAVSEDESQIVSILQNLGDVGSKIVTILTDAALSLRENVDLEQVNELTSKFSDLFDVVVLFVDTLIGGTEGAGDSIDKFVGIIIQLVDGLVAGAEKVARFGATIRIMTSGIVDATQAFGDLITGDLDGFFRNLDELSQNPIHNQQALTEEIAKTDSALGRFNQRIEENKKRQEERAKAAEDASEADTTAIDKALAGLSETEAKATEAQKAVLKLQQALTKQFVENQIRESRRLVDAEIAESRRREDAAKDTADELTGIEEEASASRAEALAEFGEESVTFEAKAAAARQKVRDETRKRETESERKFRQQLRDIQIGFERSARDAMLANDVRAFLNAKIQRNDAIAGAKQDRDDEQKEIRSEQGAKVKDLQDSLKKERQELDKDLQERLDKIDQSTQEEISRHEASLQEQEEQNKISLDRRLEDEALADARRQKDLERSLREQLAEIQANQGDIEGATAESLIKQSREYAAAFGPGGTVSTTMTEFFNQQQEELDALAKKSSGLSNGDITGQETSEPVSTDDQEGGGRDLSVLMPPDPNMRIGGESIGQQGLISQALGSPSVAFPSFGSSLTQNISTNNQSSVSMDLRGAEPLIQRIAARSALEIVQNLLAGA